MEALYETICWITPQEYWEYLNRFYTKPENTVCLSCIACHNAIPSLTHISRIHLNTKTPMNFESLSTAPVHQLGNRANSWMITTPKKSEYYDAFPLDEDGSSWEITGEFLPHRVLTRLTA